MRKRVVTEKHTRQQCVYLYAYQLRYKIKKEKEREREEKEERDRNKRGDEGTDINEGITAYAGKRQVPCVVNRIKAKVW